MTNNKWNWKATHKQWGLSDFVRQFVWRDIYRLSKRLFACLLARCGCVLLELIYLRLYKLINILRSVCVFVSLRFDLFQFVSFKLMETWMWVNASERQSEKESVVLKYKYKYVVSQFDWIQFKAKNRLTLLRRTILLGTLCWEKFDVFLNKWNFRSDFVAPEWWVTFYSKKYIIRLKKRETAHKSICINSAWIF